MVLNHNTYNTLVKLTLHTHNHSRHITMYTIGDWSTGTTGKRLGQYLYHGSPGMPHAVQSCAHSANRQSLQATEQLRVHAVRWVPCIQVLGVSSESSISLQVGAALSVHPHFKVLQPISSGFLLQSLLGYIRSPEHWQRSGIPTCLDPRMKNETG